MEESPDAVLCTKAIRFPSGDQVGWMFSRPFRIKRRGCEPSARAIQISLPRKARE
jgi:hypothetical protein